RGRESISVVMQVAAITNTRPSSSSMEEFSSHGRYCQSLENN
ncbi:hypothetical protein A2U01_0039274, partial [Trifolium medium]|nr:hypothetical protein [Trifolium medium]